MTMVKALENVAMLHYDIPSVIGRFGNWLRKELRRGKALPASKSVYLVNGSDIPRLQGVIEKAQRAYNEKYPEEAAMVSGFRAAFLHIDATSSEEVYNMAVEGMTRLIKEVQASLLKQLRKAEETGDGVLERRLQRHFVYRMRECKMLAAAFRLMDDVAGPMEETWKLVEEQVGADLAASLVKKLEAKEQAPAKAAA